MCEIVCVHRKEQGFLFFGERKEQGFYVQEKVMKGSDGK